MMYKYNPFTTSSRHKIKVLNSLDTDDIFQLISLLSNLFLYGLCRSVKGGKISPTSTSNVRAI